MLEVVFNYFLAGEDVAAEALLVGLVHLLQVVYLLGPLVVLR